MKANSLFGMLLAVFTIALFFFSCGKNDLPGPDVDFKIEDIDTITYPKVDGSTSTEPLQTLIACKLLGCDYKWRQRFEANDTWMIQPDYEKIPASFFWERIKTSQTHNSFINLIDKEADFILSARRMSDEEKAYAADKGVTLIETPVALDAFVFIVHPDNPVKSLTTKQLQDIYTGKITNWKEVGGANAAIVPYIRNANSGSQELMESLVMKGLDMPDWPEAILSSMMLAFTEIRANVNAICYTVHYYKEQIVRDDKLVKSVTVDGVYPQEKNIENGTYPFVAEIYAVIRSDLAKSTMAYQLYELLQTSAGKSIISESGYIPN